MESFKKKTVNIKEGQNKVSKSRFRNFFNKEYFSTYENFSFSNTQASSVSDNIFNYFIWLPLGVFIIISFNYFFEQFNAMFSLSSLDLIIDILPIDNSYDRHLNDLLTKKTPSLKNLKIFNFLGLN